MLLAVRTVTCQEQIDMVAGDFNGAAWRKTNNADQLRDSTIEEAFANTNLPIPHGPTPLRGPHGVPGDWAAVRGFTKSPNTDAMARSKSIAVFSTFDPLTKAWIHLFIR